MAFNPSPKLVIGLLTVFVVIAIYVMSAQSLDATRDFMLDNLKEILLGAEIVALFILTAFRKWIGSIIVMGMAIFTLIGMVQF